LLDPSSGSATLFGSPATSESNEVRRLVGYMPQQYSLYGDLSVDENLSFFGSMFCLDKASFRQLRERLLHLTRLERFGARRADALSGGMYKKLALACALLHRPRVLVLDEPTNGVDPVSRREFWELLATFVAEGMGVLISTPYMDEAARCSRVGLMHHGQILEEGKPRDMLRSFQGGTFRVEAPDRDGVAAWLENHPAVVSLSPAGGGLRVVITAGHIDEVRVAGEALGARFEPAHPLFEDVFLERLRQSDSSMKVAA
jgi:ABC-2 type transport system ATP-binding protein